MQRPVRNRLRPPPSSLRKPQVSDTTPNRAFLRGFPATHFSDFRLCGRSRILVGIFGTLSLHPKIPFPAAGFGREVRARLQPCSGLCTAVIRDLGPVLQLFRIESERLKLSAPFSRWIAEPLDADAAGQATFYGNQKGPFIIMMDGKGPVPLRGLKRRSDAEA